MIINIYAGKGEGRTELSAYDAALIDCGVSNFNLIRLSSIIPPSSKIVIKRKHTKNIDNFGDRLYVVYAEQRSDKAGEWIGAGVGWYQLEDGRGFFVEHEEVGETDKQVSELLSSKISMTLEDMCKKRRVRFDPENLRTKLVTAQVRKKPVSVIVMAVYQNEGWGAE